ncbi:MAG: Tfp pilus assembly protein FimT/FimU [Myxococcota bacterium]
MQLSLLPRPESPSPRRVRRHAGHGFTLLEMLIVLGILAITALVAMPSVAPNQGADLDVAAGQLHEAFQFARDESLRTQIRHGVEIDKVALRVKVFQNTAGTARSYGVTHPLTRGSYDVPLTLSDRARGIGISPAATWSASCGATDDVGFDAWGLPRCASDWNARLESYVLTLDLAGQQTRIGVQGETGRITLQ